jgi:hypothetical protein
MYAMRGAEDEMDKSGILCLCEEAKDILMWSHYADSHKGICLQFEVLADSPFGLATSVIYADTYPPLNISMDLHEVAIGLFRTKSCHWRYEREWRIFSNAAGFKSFPKECLSGVILGCQISPANEFLIKEWLSERSSPATLYRAVKSKDKFA